MRSFSTSRRQWRMLDRRKIFSKPPPTAPPAVQPNGLVNIVSCLHPSSVCNIGGMGSIRRSAFLLFLMLFTCQLSGLSCLDEWTVQPQNTSLSQVTTTVDDDCPCHFSFVSAPSIRVSWSSLVGRAIMNPPTTHVF